jgi:hypothetical protein
MGQTINYLGQGWRTFLRLRADWNFEEQNKALEPFTIINY